jgi:hypothetical protein
MSYPRDLDEYTDAELEAERVRRVKQRDHGLCPYCGGPLDGKPCRYPEIHRVLRVTR